MVTKTQDLYGALEVSPRARKSVIQAAYKAIMKECHPDNGGSESAARTVNMAYDLLSDPLKRQEYDKDRENLSGVIIGDYRVLKPIAEGGFGKTYLGEHIRVGKPVCIKHCSQISPQDEEILIEETRAMWDLRHYAIPAVRDLLKLDDGSLALVMSYIPGLTLEQVVQKVGPLDPEHVAWITERILNAFMYIHFHGVVHGDVKPQNIIIQHGTHQVAIVDFGLAVSKPKHGEHSKGYTPYFAPPEEIAGQTILPESDFYSLGMTMIYALSGGLDHVLLRDVPKSTPDAICEFIKKLIVHNVLGRPHDDEKLFAELQQIRTRVFGRSTSGMKPIPGIS
ncbi:MAG: protein kinase [bacterium]|nr:protein kinase [bacterium]